MRACAHACRPARVSRAAQAAVQCNRQSAAPRAFTVGGRSESALELVFVLSATLHSARHHGVFVFAPVLFPRPSQIA
eukprot:IDg17138t1